MGNSNTERVSARLDASLALILDEQARAATTAWVAAWDDVSNELLTALDELTATGVKPTRSQIMRSARLRNALLLIEDRLAGAFDTSAGRTIVDLHRIVEQAGVGADLLVSTLLPADLKVRSWTRVDPRQVDAIVARSTKQITARSLPLAPEATRVMKRELVRGLLVGENPRETARRMVRRAEGTFNGGLARALTIARTETLDAHRAASMLGYRQNADVLEGWEWHADLSSRTCSACWAMHGTIHPLDEPGPAGHQNCRCTGLPVLKDPAELGFETPDPVSIVPDAEARFNALSPAEQLDVLGPSRFAAWKAGEFPMSAWAQKRSMDGWRDSWVPAKAPAEFRGIRKANIPGGSGGRGGGSAGLGNVPIGGDGEPMRSVLPKDYVSGVRSVPDAKYRDLAPISEYTIAPESDPRRYLKGNEIAIADDLEARGLRTLGVREDINTRNQEANHRPEVVTWDSLHRVEFKTLTSGTYNSINRETRRSSVQSRRVVQDLKATKLERAEAIRHLGRLVKSSRGPYIDEIVLLLADGSAVGWSRYA